MESNQQADMVIQMFNTYDFSWRWTRRDDILCFGLAGLLIVLIIGAFLW
jgi:hypothetical protein